MASEAVDLSYHYPFPSSASLERGEGRIRLATSGGTGEAPHFFRGRLIEPAREAALLLTVSKIAQSRFYTPPGMVQRILREADPVVTSGGKRLRFESFSLCCGVYARADLLPDALDGEVVGRGTTNVDFNPPFRAALAQVKKGDRVGLNVGSDRVELESESGSVEERKVKLPQRWLKGFVESQAYSQGPRRCAMKSLRQTRAGSFAGLAEIRLKPRITLLPCFARPASAAQPGRCPGRRPESAASAG